MSWIDDFLPSGWNWLNFSLDKRHYDFLLGKGWWRHSVCCNRILQLKFLTFRSLVIFLSIVTMSHVSTSHSILMGGEELGFGGLLIFGHYTVFNFRITGLVVFSWWDGAGFMNSLFICLLSFMIYGPFHSTQYMEEWHLISSHDEKKTDRPPIKCTSFLTFLQCRNCQTWMPSRFLSQALPGTICLYTGKAGWCVKIQPESFWVTDVV